MKFFCLSFALLTAAALAACNPAAEFSADERATHEAATHSVRPVGPSVSDQRRAAGDATCPCFSRSTLSNADRVLAASGSAASDYYLFFDVFNYYDLDARRTEARALVSTPAGPLEEVASVYITRGSGDDLFLICHQQEVVQDPVTGEPSYRYDTLAPTVKQAEACRREIYAAVGEQEPCQGAACGIEYSEEQLDPTYPPYNDGNFRTPERLLDAMRQRVEAVAQMLRLPA